MTSKSRPERFSSAAIATRFLALVLGMGCLLLTSAAFAAEDLNDGSSGGQTGDMEEGAYDDDSWEYDSYYIFPLTRHMSDSELPMAGQIALYPLACVIDLVQWPIGALAGLAGK